MEDIVEIDFSQLRRKLVADGLLGDEDVKELEEVMLDGGMTMEKGDFLFSLKDSLNHEKLSKEFKPLFVESIAALLLEDETSPGEIDDSEAKWLRAKLQSNTTLDDYDKALLKVLRERSINYPQILNFKGFITRKFEKCIYFSRYLTLLAVIGSLIAAVALFLKGAVLVYDATKELIATFSSPHYTEMLEMFVASVDVFLFAMVLVIFGIGIYELFISKLDPVLQKVDNRPSWLKINSVDDLKSSLGKVILMVLIVTFFKWSINNDYDEVDALLKLGGGILLIALALYFTHKSH